MGRILPELLGSVRGAAPIAAQPFIPVPKGTAKEHPGGEAAGPAGPGEHAQLTCSGLVDGARTSPGVFCPKCPPATTCHSFVLTKFSKETNPGRSELLSSKGREGKAAVGFFMPVMVRRKLAACPGVGAEEMRIQIAEVVSSHQSPCPPKPANHSCP